MNKGLATALGALAVVGVGAIATAVKGFKEIKKQEKQMKEIDEEQVTDEEKEGVLKRALTRLERLNRAADEVSARQNREIKEAVAFIKENK